LITSVKQEAGSMSLVESSMQVRVWRPVPEHAYLLMTGIMALLITVSMTIPFASILVGAVLLRSDRWKQIVVIASVGSATGGVILYWIFYHLGWSQIIVAYPDLIRSQVWSDATRWVSTYGAWALLGVAASPLPQTPALIFTAVLPLPATHVFLALFIGKLIKYGIYGWLAANFPHWFDHFIHAVPNGKRYGGVREYVSKFF
jgi:membrane protein YqaA with SNARE-associated domain